ncbi:MAG: cofactor-independent phosphoglycerate mutase, partial [Planctomycetes bacterium]|nr:cofactor-independent phosphoglycerate mutase [Planctomycetota bacterium]
MKYAIVIPDGAADLPLDELDGKTPLAAAKTPNMDWLADNGRCGTTCNIPEGMPCGSDVAILSVLGYDPREFYTGRAPLEAAAKGLDISPDECVFRCNLVTIVDGIMEDHSAGHITTEEAQALMNELSIQTSDQNVRFVTGVSYRHLLILKGRGLMQTTPPHDILGRQADRYLPKGPGDQLLRDLIAKSQALFPGHEINTVRRDLGDNVASSIWLWGQGKMPTLESFEKRWGIKGAAVTAVDLVRGLARLIGWERIDVEGATGYLDTNYAGKAQAAIDALSRVDLAFVHVEAPDEAGHNADPAAKVAAIEQIDQHVVGPLLEHLKSYGEDWRMLVMPDHPTPCTLRTHTADEVPFA